MNNNEYIKKVQEQAREAFKNHKLDTIIENDQVKQYLWHEPGTNNMHINLIFIGNHVYISGDVREAVYWCTWKTSLKSCADTNLGYFTGKLSCNTNGKQRWTSEDCAEDVEAWKNEKLSYKNEYDDVETFERELDEFVEDILFGSDDKPIFIANLYNAKIGDYEEECESELWNAGERLNQDLVYYHTAIQMAQEYIENEASKLERFIGLKVGREVVKFNGKRRIFFNGACYQIFNSDFSVVSKARINKLIKSKTLIECDPPESYKNRTNLTWYKLNVDIIKDGAKDE